MPSQDRFAGFCERLLAALGAAHKTLLALLHGLAVLVVLSAAARLARIASLGFVSDSYGGGLCCGSLALSSRTFSHFSAAW